MASAEMETKHKKTRKRQKTDRDDTESISGSSLDAKRLRRFAAAHQLILCPICQSPPKTVDEYFRVCKNGHNLCFDCILGMIRAQRTQRLPLKCPTCRAHIFSLEPLLSFTKRLISTLLPPTKDDRPLSEKKLTLFTEVRQRLGTDDALSPKFRLRDIRKFAEQSDEDYQKMAQFIELHKDILSIWKTVLPPARIPGIPLPTGRFGRARSAGIGPRVTSTSLPSSHPMHPSNVLDPFLRAATSPRSPVSLSRRRSGHLLSAMSENRSIADLLWGMDDFDPDALLGTDTLLGVAGSTGMPIPVPSSAHTRTTR